MGTTRRLAALGVGLLGVAACEFKEPTGPIVSQQRYELVIVSGDAQSDTVGALTEPITFRVQSLSGEPVPIADIDVAFSVQDERCGVPTLDQQTSDGDGTVEVRWQLGEVPGDCRLLAQALAPSGGSVGLATARSVVLPGAPDAGWLVADSVYDFANPADLSGTEFHVLDRLGNEVLWRFSVLTGSLLVSSSNAEDPSSRSLVATGAGAGRIAVLVGETTFAEAGVRACQTTSGLLLRLQRGVPLGEAPSCPST